MRLLVLQWIEGSLPDYPEGLRRYVQATESEWEDAWPVLERKFPVSLDGRRRNERLEHERAEMERIRGLQSFRGKLGGRPKKAGGNPEESRGFPAGLPEQTQNKANQEPRTNNQKKDLLVQASPAPDISPKKEPPVHWDVLTEQVRIDETWLHDEIDDYQREAGVRLTRKEYEHEVEMLRLKLLADPRLRASLQKLNGKPSAPSQFKRLASYASSWFKTAIQRKAKFQKQPPRASPNGTEERVARGNEAFQKAMAKALEKEAQVGDGSGSTGDLGGAEVFLPSRSGGS